MIRTKDDHARAKERLEGDKAYLERLEATLGEADLTPEERERALQPALAFHAQLLEEVEAYERAPAASRTVTEEIREGLRQLSAYDEASVELWLRTPHPTLDGDVPQELIDAGEGEVVLALVEHMRSARRPDLRPRLSRSETTCLPSAAFYRLAWGMSLEDLIIAHHVASWLLPGRRPLPHHARYPGAHRRADLGRPLRRQKHTHNQPATGPRLTRLPGRPHPG